MKEFFGGHFRPRHAMNFVIEKEEEEKFVPDAGAEGGGGPLQYYILAGRQGLCTTFHFFEGQAIKKKENE